VTKPRACSGNTAENLQHESASRVLLIMGHKNRAGWPSTGTVRRIVYRGAPEAPAEALGVDPRGGRPTTRIASRLCSESAGVLRGIWQLRLLGEGARRLRRRRDHARHLSVRSSDRPSHGLASHQRKPEPAPHSHQGRDGWAAYGRRRRPAVPD
jgi:hypothetical protein